MVKNKKVSIIVPCYNMEKYVHVFFESLLAQKYSNVELIIVNDNSKDNLEGKIFRYKKFFENNGIKLIYIKHKNNKGLGEAINSGLKVFSGDYLTWCDPDDFFLKDSLRKKVDFLEKNLSYGLVRSDCFVFNENDLKKPLDLITKKNKNRFKEEIFEDIIMEQNIHITAGCYMIRASVFLDVLPSRQIYPAKRGQNWQLLLPVTYKYKCGYIDEPLYGYIIRQESMSREDDFIEKKLRKCDEHQEILLNVINSIDLDKEYYSKLIKEKYIRKKLLLAAKYRNKELGNKYYSYLLKNNSVNLKDKRNYYMSKNLFFYLVIKNFSRVYRFIRNCKERVRRLLRITK